MKTSMTALVAMITIGSVGLVAGNAVACHGGGFGGGFGYNNSVEYTRNVYVEAPASAPVFAPGHGMIVVMPGDSWFTISSREYGNTSVWSRIAEFNGLPQNLPLTVGMQLRLPVINPNGSLSVSNAPAMIAQGFNGGFPNKVNRKASSQACSKATCPKASPKVACPKVHQFGQQGGMPQGGQFGQQGGMPQGQQFGAQGGQPQGGQFGQQGGQPKETVSLRKVKASLLSKARWALSKVTAARRPVRSSRSAVRPAR